MSNTQKKWKIDIACSLISASICTLLYAIFKLLGPGPGFQDSMIARLAIGELFITAVIFIFACVIGILALGTLFGILFFIYSVLGISEDEASCFALGWVISIPIILYFSVALGFVSIGVM